jgi:hypothetical protein
MNLETRTVRQTNRKTDGQNDVTITETDKRTNIHTDQWTDNQTNRPTDGFLSAFVLNE